MPQSQPPQISRIEEVVLLVPKEARPLLLEAYNFASGVLTSQKRVGGGSYIEHIVATGLHLARWHQSPNVIAAGLLHSVVSDNRVSVEEVKHKFGKEIAELVNGSLHLINLHYRGMSKHAEDLRRFFVALSRDLRVIFITFAHRLDEMRSISTRPEIDQRRIALETMEIYAPLANRLGMGQLKTQYEVLAFPILYPTEYKRALALMKKSEAETNKNLEKIYRSLRKLFAKEHIEIISADHRRKNIYSLYKKLAKNDWEIDNISDLLALRIITKNVEDCYKILGLIHSKYKPVGGKVKDYIASPKPNGYKSVHTTIYTGAGTMAEVQIRTKEMHNEAEHGVAAHIAYEEGNKPQSGGRWSAKLAWVRELINLTRDREDDKEFIKSIELDFFKSRIFVFTPVGEVIELPEGASVLDFAFAIHTDLGRHAKAAIINGKYSAIDTVLMGGETIRVETAKNTEPHHKWLGATKTSLARKQIRAHISKKIKAKS